jgi:hypothetical protein
VWVAALAALALRRRPRTPDVGPVTLDLGPEPPAIVNFLTHGFKATPEAVPATLLDLAARGSFGWSTVGRTCSSAASASFRPT